jgi:hypothetical protein
VEVAVPVKVGIGEGDAVEVGATVDAGGEATGVVPQALRTSVKIPRADQ